MVDARRRPRLLGLVGHSIHAHTRTQREDMRRAYANHFDRARPRQQKQAALARLSPLSRLATRSGAPLALPTACSAKGDAIHPPRLSATLSFLVRQTCARSCRDASRWPAKTRALIQPRGSRRVGAEPRCNQRVDKEHEEQQVERDDRNARKLGCVVGLACLLACLLSGPESRYPRCQCLRQLRTPLQAR